MGLLLFIFELVSLFSFLIPIQRNKERKIMAGQWGEEVVEEVVIRCYDDPRDRSQIDCVEKSCEIGHDYQTLLFTDTLGDPICRIRNNPLFTMLVIFLSLLLSFVYTSLNYPCFK